MSTCLNSNLNITAVNVFLCCFAVHKKGQKGRKEVSEQKRKDKEKKNGNAENDKSREEEEEEEERMEEEPEAENDVEDDEVENWWHVHGDFIRGSITVYSQLLSDHKRSTMKFA